MKKKYKLDLFFQASIGSNFAMINSNFSINYLKGSIFYSFDYMSMVKLSQN